MKETSRLLTFAVKYFKPTGKYYATGYFSLQAQTTELDDGRYSVSMFDVVEYLEKEFLSGNAPGLSSWSNNYIVLLEHEEGYPILFPLISGQNS
jgi:hypothetical protein